MATIQRLTIGQDGSATVRLRNVRLSFPALFEARSMEEGKKPTFQATFLIDPQDENAKYLKQGIDALVKSAFKGKHPGRERVCLRDGADKAERGIDGYEGMWYCSSNCVKAPPVVDRDLTPLTAKDNKPYAGCYVNATIRLWTQDSKEWGKRVNAQLRAVQFWGDGEPFGEGSANTEEEFADTSEGGTSADAADAL